jgi:antitoxin component YwqK of YwqJK toxin-antitoxin module
MGGARRRGEARKGMPKGRGPAVDHIEYHKDGSVWAKGQKLDGVLTGYWEWFRKDGTKMRSGFFEAGRQIGEWTTYDRAGKVYKVTNMTPKSKR